MAASQVLKLLRHDAVAILPESIEILAALHFWTSVVAYALHHYFAQKHSRYVKVFGPQESVHWLTVAGPTGILRTLSAAPSKAVTAAEIMYQYAREKSAET